jgi:surface protein
VGLPIHPIVFRGPPDSPKTANMWQQPSLLLSCIPLILLVSSNTIVPINSFDLLPNGNGAESDASDRVGSLGGVIDDVLSSNAAKRNTVISKYGELKYWNVSHVTHFGYLFHNKNTFNGNLSLWKTTSAKNMERMFCNCFDFNSDISNFDTSKVTTFYSMFYKAGKKKKKKQR